MAYLTIQAGQWRGNPPDGQLWIWPTGVMAGIEPGWLTLTGWRQVGHTTQPATVQVLAIALPIGIRPEVPWLASGVKAPVASAVAEEMTRNLGGEDDRYR